MPTVRVNAKGAARAASGHPWIFSSDVLDRGHANPGDTVQVLDPKGRPLGQAHYSSTSQITLRLLPSSISEALQQAVAHRKRIVKDSTAFRLVHAEADLLPGLIIDIYDDCAVIQTQTQAMDRAKQEIADLLPYPTVVERNDSAVREKESLPRIKGVLKGEPPEPKTIHFNGLQWTADLFGGQKTGVYLDQRENYQAAARHAKGRALDCFTSTGGFALHLAKTCDQVEAVDSSDQALSTAESNAKANNIANISFKQNDVFDLLASTKRRFDTIVLDPPAFAKSRSQIEGARKGYREINQRALKLLEPGGILITCSCSHHFSESMLLETIAEAALEAGKTLRILERRTQSQDHPILLTVPETLYLKCLVFELL